MPARPPTAPLPRLRTAPPTATEETLEQFARGTDALPLVHAEAPADQLRDLEHNLEQAISTLTMHFQPIVHAGTHARFGYEALLRTTDQSLPHPGAVFDAAERLEKVQKLGRAIRSQIANIFAAEPAERGYVFLNLHVQDFHDKQLASSFAPLSKIASRVILEITERTSLASQEQGVYRIAELRELGFKIAIDNLGSGLAPLGQLSLLDTDFAKVDMALVRGIDRDETKQRVVRSVTEMCRNHNTLVIAEGVETEGEARTLTELGCDLLQGYLIARPALPFCDPL